MHVWQEHREGLVVQACREALRKENLKVQWQQSNKRWVATFYFPRDDEALHVVPGDELVLQHDTGALLFFTVPATCFFDQQGSERGQTPKEEPAKDI